MIQWFKFREAGNFLFITVSRPVLRPIQTPIQWVTTGAHSLQVKGPVREADQSLQYLVPMSKDECSYATIPLIRLHGMVLS